LLLLLLLLLEKPAKTQSMFSSEVMTLGDGREVALAERLLRGAGTPRAQMQVDLKSSVTYTISAAQGQVRAKM
jgi:hypothetical protein